jgi:hypothetical protein
MLDHNAPTVPMPAQAPVPPQPTFPYNGINVIEEGVTVTTFITPHTQFVTFIPDEMLTQINKKRLEMKKAQRDKVSIVRDIKRTNTVHS